MRNGISLLEVLISVFVILVGLLGVVALIPVGHGQAQKAVTYDRASALGKAVLSDVAVRNMLDPSRWCFADGTTDFDETTTGSQPFVLDPLYAAENATAAGVNWFPVAPTASDPQLLPRFSLHGLTLDLARRLAVGSDDLVFSATDREARPQAVLDGNGIQASKGEYSWLLTVQPMVSESALPYEDKSLYSVSAAVYRQRSLTDREAIATVTFQSTDTLCRDVTLTFPSLEIPDIRTGWWILLWADSVDVAGWYRVVAVGDDPSLPLERYLSLAGGDWPQTVDAAGNPVFVPTVAIVTEGVVGVYTEKLER